MKQKPEKTQVPSIVVVITGLAALAFFVVALFVAIDHAKMKNMLEKARPVSANVEEVKTGDVKKHNLIIEHASGKKFRLLQKKKPNKFGK